MALRKIVTLEDPVLRKTSRKVEKFDKRLWDLLDDMKDTLYSANGAGLAAVQVGILRRVVVIDVGDGLMELVNPEITERSDEKQEEVEAQNREGKWVGYKGEGLKARCFCHELDHLDGVLYIDNALEMYDEED